MSIENTDIKKSSLGFGTLVTFFAIASLANKPPSTPNP